VGPALDDGCDSITIGLAKNFDDKQHGRELQYRGKLETKLRLFVRLLSSVFWQCINLSSQNWRRNIKPRPVCGHLARQDMPAAHGHAHLKIVSEQGVVATRPCGLLHIAGDGGAGTREYLCSGGKMSR